MVGGKPKKGALIMLRWRDAHSSSGWVKLTDHDEDAVCETAGWVVRKSDLFLTLAPHRYVDTSRGEMVGDPISIPWGMVILWEPL